LTYYSKWPDLVDYNSKHRRLLPVTSKWTNKKSIYEAFDQLFEKFQNSILVVSYRSDGIPAESELFNLLQKYKQNVTLEYFGHYKYVLSTNSESKEVLLIGVD